MLYFLMVPEMRLTGQLDNVDLRAAHGGIFSFQSSASCLLAWESPLFFQVHFNGNLNNTVNLIELWTLRNTRIPVTMSHDEDPEPFLAGAGPNLALFVSPGNHIDGFKVPDVLKGNLKASSTFPADGRW